MAAMSIVGDCIHMLIDGALIGATFLADTTEGWIVTLAIVAHEIPQELGDLAILLNAGMGWKKAALVNLGVQSFSFIGASIALGVGSEVADLTLNAAPFAGGLFM